MLMSKLQGNTCKSHQAIAAQRGEHFHFSPAVHDGSPQKAMRIARSATLLRPVVDTRNPAASKNPHAEASHSVRTRLLANG
jgi:hypothetical protein